MVTKLWVIILILFTTLLTSSAQILLKLGANTLAFNLDGIVNHYLIGGIFLYGIASISAIIAFRKGEVTTLYPIFATSYIWVSFLSTYFFDETMDIFKWSGIIIIIAGITLIGIQNTKLYVSEGNSQ